MLKPLLCVPSLFIFLSLSLSAQEETASAEELRLLAERIVASPSSLEQVQLAQYARRRDPGGSAWWFEVEARARFKRGEHAAVVRVCNEALANPIQDEDKERMYRLRASAYQGLHDAPHELGDLAQIMRFAPGDIEIQTRYHGLIAPLIQEHQYIVARSETYRRVEHLPDSAVPRLRMARYAMRQDQPEYMWEWIQEAIEVDEAGLSAEDWGWYGDLLLEEWRFEECIDALERAIQLDPATSRKQQLARAKARWQEALRQEEEEARNAELEEPEEPALVILSPERLREELARYEERWEKLMPRHLARVESYRSIKARYRELDLRLESAQDLESIRSASKVLKEEHSAWFDAHLEFEGEALICSDEQGQTMRQFWEREIDQEGQALYDLYVEVARKYLPLEKFFETDLPNFFENSLAERQAALDLEQTISRAERRATELLANRKTLAPELVKARAGELLSQGATSPELMAAFGLACVATGDIERALVPLHSSLASGAEHALAGDVRECLQELEQSVDSMVRSASQLEQQGQLDAALGLLERATDRAPLGADAFALKARFLLERGDSLGALASIRRASALAQDDVSIAMAHSVQALRTSSPSEALELADHMLRIAPRDHEAWKHHGNVLFVLGQKEQARRELDFVGASRMGALPKEHWKDRPVLVSTLAPDWYSPATWDELHQVDVWDHADWIPNHEKWSSPGNEIAARLHAILLRQADIDSLLAPVEGLDAESAAEWPLVSVFLQGECLLFLDGDREAARGYYEKLIRNPKLKGSLLYVCAYRIGGYLSGGPTRPAPFNSIPIHVPGDARNLATAINVASPGQAIRLPARTIEIAHDITKSVRIEGAGMRQTILALATTAPNDSGKTNVNLRPMAASGEPGIIEFVDLNFQNHGRFMTYEEEESSILAFAVGAGAALLERCTFSRDTAFSTGPESFLSLFDCDLTYNRRPPILASGGALVVDTLRLDDPLIMAGGASLLGDRISLTKKASLKISGAGTHAEIGSLAGIHLLEEALQLSGGATCQVQQMVWGSSAEASLVRADDESSVEIERLDSFGRGLPGALASSMPPGTFKAFVALAEADVPETANSTEQLQSLLKSGARNITIEPGEYFLHNIVVEGELSLRASEPGVKLSVTTDLAASIFVVAEGGELRLEGIMLDIYNWREGSVVVEGNEIVTWTKIKEPFDTYPLLDVRGEVQLWDCSLQENRQTHGDATLLLARVEQGKLTSIGLKDGLALEAASSAKVLLVDGGVRHLYAEAGAEVRLVGLGTLETLEVRGASTEVLLDDFRIQRTERVDYEDGSSTRYEDYGIQRTESVAFRDGAHDPRSALRKRTDGSDPELLQAKLLYAARTQWLAPLDSSSSDEEMAIGLIGYLEEHESALVLTVSSRREREDLSVATIMPYLAGRPARIQVVFHRLRLGYSGYNSWFSGIILRNLPQDDLIRYYAENRAVAALGKDASKRSLDIYQEWEEALLSGRVTQKERDAAKESGLGIRDYRAEQRRLALLRQEADNAISSGDKGRIRRSLTAISLDDWLSYVLNDTDATLSDVREALAASNGTARESALAKRVTSIENEAWDAQQRALEDSYGRSNSGGGYNSSGSGGYSQDYSTPGFAASSQAFNTWNRDMGLELKAIKNSSYTSFRNRYDY